MRHRPTNPIPRFILLAAVLWAGSPALADAGGPYEMEVLVDGVPLRELRARGTTYVEAVRGAEYAIRLRNHTGRRVAVALAVDGLNTVDARHTTAGEARKWVLGPWESITLEGWQTGRDTARRFVFTTEDDSYGAWIGHTDDLGSIMAAFFREVEPVPSPPAPVTEPRSQRSGKSSGEARSMRESRAGTERDAIAESESGAPSRDHAATGIGREVDHRVRTVGFRSEPHPAAVIRIRYEYRDALARLGVLPCPPRPLHRRERASGFSDLEFAPDPYR